MAGNLQMREGCGGRGVVGVGRGGEGAGEDMGKTRTMCGTIT